MVDIHTIKLIDEELIAELVKRVPRKVVMVGVENMLGESGTPQVLLKKYGLIVEDIVKDKKIRKKFIITN